MRSITEGAREIGIWFDRTKEYLARKRGKATVRSDFETRYEIRVHPLPCWENLPHAEQRSKACELVLEITEEARVKRLATGKRPLGVAAILRQDPQQRPEHVASSPAPMVHASSRWERRWFNDQYYRFLRRYRSASERFLAGAAQAIREFPRRCFLPRPPVGIRYPATS